MSVLTLTRNKYPDVKKILKSGFALLIMLQLLSINLIQASNHEWEELNFTINTTGDKLVTIFDDDPTYLSVEIKFEAGEEMVGSTLVVTYIDLSTGDEVEETEFFIGSESTYTFDFPVKVTKLVYDLGYVTSYDFGTYNIKYRIEKRAAAITLVDILWIIAFPMLITLLSFRGEMKKWKA
ncbi:MAG: hypothetical protein OEY49_14975 [Candidatus Heimdallarchaeota archaeon]|nr:hypothetical protein [Candidatus Heimdallarchaeota archaeon]